MAGPIDEAQQFGVLAVVAGALYLVYKLFVAGDGVSGGTSSGTTRDAAEVYQQYVTDGDVAPEVAGANDYLEASRGTTDVFARTGNTLAQTTNALLGEEYSTVGTFEETATGSGETRRLYEGRLVPWF